MATRRQPGRKDVAFLVFFHCDETFMVRGRQFIRTDGEVKVGEEYDIQWGRYCETNEGEICGSGTKTEMTELMRTKLAGPPALPDLPAPAPAPVQPKPSKPRKAVAKRPNGKPVATVIKRVAGRTLPPPAEVPPADQVSDHHQPEDANDDTPAEVIVDTPTDTPTEEVIDDTQTEDVNIETVTTTTTTTRSWPPANLPVSSDEEEDAPADVFTFTEQGTPQRPLLRDVRRSPGPGTPTLGALMSQMNALEASVRAIAREQERLRKQEEAKMRHLQTITDLLRGQSSMLEGLVARSSQTPARTPTLDLFDEGVEDTVPAEYAMSDEELKDLFSSTGNAGHYAAKLSQRLYPELFGVANLKLRYNFFGGGVQQKQALSPRRKEVIRTYVCRYYPEMRDDGRFRESCVYKINELLRRPSSKRKATTQGDRPTPEHQALSVHDTVLPEYSPNGDFSMRRFLEL